MLETFRFFYLIEKVSYQNINNLIMEHTIWYTFRCIHLTKDKFHQNTNDFEQSI